MSKIDLTNQGILGIENRHLLNRLSILCTPLLDGVLLVTKGLLCSLRARTRCLPRHSMRKRKQGDAGKMERDGADQQDKGRDEWHAEKQENALGTSVSQQCCHG